MTNELGPDIVTEPKPLELMSAQAKKRFKVKVAMLAVDTWTTWANDKEEAQDLVLNQGFGRNAGREGPKVVEVLVEEMGDGNPDNAAVIDNAETENDPKVKPLIEVVRS